MKTYSFSLILHEPDVSDAQCDRLYASGCEDGTVVTRDGRTYIAFDRDADSLEQAIRSASQCVRSAGFSVDRVEMGALV